MGLDEFMRESQKRYEMDLWNSPYSNNWKTKINQFIEYNGLSTNQILNIKREMCESPHAYDYDASKCPELQVFAKIWNRNHPNFNVEVRSTEESCSLHLVPSN